MGDLGATAWSRQCLAEALPFPAPRHVPIRASRSLVTRDTYLTSICVITRRRAMHFGSPANANAEISVNRSSLGIDGILRRPTLARTQPDPTPAPRVAKP